AIDTIRRNAADEFHGTRDAHLQFGEGPLVVLVVRHVHLRQTRHDASRLVAGDLHLLREWIHVGREPIVHDGSDVDLAGVRMRLRLVEDLREVLEEIRQSGNTGLVHRDLHGKALRSDVRTTFFLPGSAGQAGASIPLYTPGTRA